MDSLRNVIVCMEFLRDEMLLVIFGKGELWLIDPHNGQVSQRRLEGLMEG